MKRIDQVISEEKSEIQESAYEFPYHYLPRFGDGKYTQTATLAWGYEYLFYIEFVKKLIRSMQYESVLDVGCGDGRLLYELHQESPEKAFCGLDTSPRAIRLAQAMSPDVTYVCGDVTDRTLLSGQSDIVTLVETLEHIPPSAISEFLSGIQYYLKSTGVLIVTVPSSNVPVHRKHYQHFTLKSLQDTLSPAFEVVDCHYLNKVSAVSRLIPTLLSNRLFAVQSTALLGRMYFYYAAKFGVTAPNNAGRICVICRPASLRNKGS